MKKICGVIPTFNGEKYIDGAVRQLIKACDEVIVIDSGSTDDTLNIVRQHDCRLVEHPFESYGAQCTYAATLTDCDWILINDHDEIMTDELVNEIKSLQQKGFDKGIYIIKRNNFFLGKLIQYSGWGDEGETKLFNKQVAQHTFENHAVILPLDGNTGVETGTLTHVADHYPYQSIRHYLDKVYTYAEIAADEAVAKGKTFKLRYLLFNPVVRFIKKYFIQLGILDGFHGFILAVLSYYSVFLKYLKIWEITQDKDK